MDQAKDQPAVSTTGTTWPVGTQVIPTPEQERLRPGNTYPNDNTMDRTLAEEDEGILWLPVFLGLLILISWMVFSFMAGQWYNQANHIADVNTMVRPVPCSVVPIGDVYGK